MHQGQYTATLGMVLGCLFSTALASQPLSLTEDAINPLEHAAPAPDVNSVEPVLFSQGRGFYTHAFYLILTTGTDDATVYYTTDGSVPNPETARIALDHGQASPGNGRHQWGD